MNELQKMKLRMSRGIMEGGIGGEDPFKKYDDLDAPKIHELVDTSRKASEIADGLTQQGFDATGLCRTVLGKPFEAEEFELFLLYLVESILEVNSRTGGRDDNHFLYKNIAKFLKKYEIIDEAKFNKINSDLDSNNFKLD